jgi:hypothetical protein
MPALAAMDRGAGMIEAGAAAIGASWAAGTGAQPLAIARTPTKSILKNDGLQCIAILIA